jgi:hypothetical protein
MSPRPFDPARKTGATTLPHGARPLFSHHRWIVSPEIIIAEAEIRPLNTDHCDGTTGLPGGE